MYKALPSVIGESSLLNCIFGTKHHPVPGLLDNEDAIFRQTKDDIFCLFGLTIWHWALL
jgi:hypothetical protein